MATKKDELVNVETGEVYDDLNGVLSETELNAVEASFESLSELARQWGLDDDDLIIGDAYPLVEKDELIGVPLFLVQWRFGLSQNFGSEYTQVQAVAKFPDGERKVGIFDSGVGIYGALNRVTNQRIEKGSVKPPYNGLLAPKGLTVSEYPAKYEDGAMIRPAGKTYYFA